MTPTLPKNPLDRGPKPPFPPQGQQPPGLESKMNPLPDFGEQSYIGHGRLTGKAAIVTGGDSGIGRAVALAFAREGADVCISYLSEDSDAATSQQVVEQAGRKAIAIRGDIGDERHCQRIVQQAVQTFGHLDILVNNAGFQMYRPNLEEQPSDEIEHTFRTNILAMFWLVKAALPHMQPGSAIVNTASIEAFKANPALTAYASTKGAIIAFTTSLAQQLVKKGIRVNAVAPGPVWTPLIVASKPPELLKKQESQPLKFGSEDPERRPAQPAELAPAYVFLASPEASYVNGCVLSVTGGEPMP